MPEKSVVGKITSMRYFLFNQTEPHIIVAHSGSTRIPSLVYPIYLREFCAYRHVTATRLIRSVGMDNSMIYQAQAFGGLAKRARRLTQSA
jgi:hypothetical protein